jgi:hypothetical protein
VTAKFPPEVAHLPVCPHRGLPIPFIAEIGGDGVGHFAILDPARQRECAADRLCAMCGLPMGEEVALIGDVVSLDPGGFWIEPPVHERCGELAIGGLCPFISRERVPRRPVEDDGTVTLLGSVEEMAKVGREGGPAKRPVVMAVVHSYRMAVHMGGANGPMPVFMSFDRPVRVRRYEWDAEGRAAEVRWREPVDPELFARTAPKWNCVDNGGPHYRLADGSCGWCGDQIEPPRPQAPRVQPRRSTRAQRRQ